MSDPQTEAAPFELSVFEETRIKRLVALLSDESTQLRIVTVLMGVYPTADSEVLAELARGFVTHIGNSTNGGKNPAEVVSAAQSVEVICNLLGRITSIPDDFYPSNDLVEKCLHEYFDRKKIEAAGL